MNGQNSKATALVVEGCRFKPDLNARRVHRFRKTRGFSLVELLVVVLVVGVLAAISIPGFSNITEAARAARDQRNAQTIVSLASAAQAAGFTNDWGTKTNAIALLVAGIFTTNSIHGSQLFSFSVDALSPANQASAASYIQLSGNMLIYIPAGGQTD